MTIALQAAPVLGGLNTAKPRLLAVHAKFVVDATGSTGPFTTGVSKVIKSVVQEVPSRVGESHFGLHASRDRDYAETDVNLGDDLPIGDMIKNLDLIQYVGGGDEDETQIDSVLEAAKNTVWASGTGIRRVIVLITSSGSKNARDGSDATAAGAGLRGMGVKVIVVAPLGCNVHALAANSGGVSIPLSNDPSNDELTQVQNALTKSLSI